MTTDFHTVMRSMDAAADIRPDPQRREALCEQIMATPRAVAGSASLAVGSPADGSTAAGATVATPSTPRRRWMSSTRARLAAAGGAVAAGVAAFTLVGGGSPAYAAWSATPEPVSAHDLRVAQAACEPELRALDTIPASYHSSAGRPPLALSERRGDYVLLQYATNAGEQKEQACLVTLSPGAEKASDVSAAGTGSDQPLKAPTSQSAWEGGLTTQGEPPLTVLTGAVGAEVRGVTVHAGDKSVRATVRNGMFTAVWPGTAFDADNHRKPLNLDVTLDDGRVLTDVESNDG